VKFDFPGGRNSLGTQIILFINNTFREATVTYETVNCAKCTFEYQYL
jgi:hypothetical protein